MSADVNGAIAGWLSKALVSLGDPDGLASGVQSLQRQRIAAEVAVRQLAATPALGGTSATAAAQLQALEQHRAGAEELLERLRASEQELREHGTKAQQTAKQVIGLVLELLEVLAAGYALTVLFGWASNLIWARAMALMSRIALLLQRIQTGMRSFAVAMAEHGAWTGRLGSAIETAVVDLTPAYVRAYPGFVLASSMPSLMSGRPVDWATNAWQTALFVGLDAAAYGTFRVIEQTALGARFKQFVVGRPAADDAGAAGRSADDAGRSAGDDVARSGADDVGDAVPAVAGSVGGAGRSGATVTSRGALRPEAAQPPRIALACPASPSRSSTSRSSDGFEVPTRTGRLHPRTEPHPFAARPPRPVSVHRPTGRPPRESPPDRDGLLEHAAPSPSSRPRRFRPPPVPPSPRSGVRPSA
ncbi:hypothetical protein, partial [Angustibacter aerolatus]